MVRAGTTSGVMIAPTLAPSPNLEGSVQKWLRPVSFALVAALAVGTFYSRQEAADPEAAASDLPDPVAMVGAEAISRAELEAGG